MNKKVIFSGVMMLILLASCGAKDTVITEVSEVAVETSAPSDTVVSGQEEVSVFLSEGFAQYDEALIGETESTVLFFHSAGCSSCRATEESLLETGVSSGTTILKIDFDADENFELRKQYGVTTYHTFVEVDANGNEIKKWGGSLSDSDIQEEISAGDVMVKEEEVMIKDEAESAEVMIKEEDVMTKNEEVMVKEEEVMIKDEAESGEVMEKVELAGTYADYDDSLVGESDSTVLAFFASWCPSCSAADKVISQEEIPEGLSVLKVDFDSATDLRKKYGVVAQHTFVQVDADGNEIKKWVGGTSVEDIVERVQ